MHLLAAHGLTRRFGRHTAVDHLEFDLPPGSVSVLCGANGAGKSTSLRLLLGLLPATAGHATVLGVDHRHLGPAVWARIGYVAEDVVQSANLTVDGLLSRWRALYPRWDRGRERRVVEAFELPRRQRLQALSRGQRMKAHIASVLPYRPELLVLDEPFSGLDLLTRDQVLRQLVDLVAQEGTSVLVSSHEISDVETLADRLLWIDRGRLLLHEETESLRARFRRVVLPFGDAPGHAWQTARSDDGSVSYIEPCFEANRSPAEAGVSAMPLRDIYLALVREPAARRRGAHAPPVITS